jgi:hypothetical protein
MDPILYSTSPSLATATYRANLNKNGRDTIERYSFLFKKHRELLDKEPDQAWQEFESLDPNIQGALTTVFGAQDYVNRPKDWTLAARAWDKVKSPFRGAFGLAIGYNRALNLPGTRALSTLGGVDNFTYKQGWDGHNQFDQEQVIKLDEQYGTAVGIISRGLAEGRTPGEILAAQPEITPELTRALDLVFNEPELYKPILNQYKRAQLSPGRIFARGVLGNKATDSTFYDVAFNVLSGVNDAAYQIAIDPLTYLTLGVGPAFTKGARLAQIISKRGQAGVNDVFKDPQVRQIWDGLGDLIKKYNDAPAANKAEVKAQIEKNYPEYATQQDISLLSEAKVFDADSANNFFSQMGHVNMLLSGKTVSVDQFRSQSVLAATTTRDIKRKLSLTLSKFWDDVNTKQKPDSTDLLNQIVKIGENPERAGQVAIELGSQGTLKLVEDGVKGFRGLLNKLAVHPGNKPIVVSDNAVVTNAAGVKSVIGVDETIETVEQVARLTMEKPVARTFAQLFRGLETEGDRLIALRGLYAYTMYRMGLGSVKGGDEFISKVITDQFGDGVTFAAKADEFLPNVFDDVLTSGQRILREQGKLIPHDSGVALNFFNETSKVAQPDWLNIAQTFSSLIVKDGGIKSEFLKRIGPITNSKTVQGVTDNWTFFTLVPKLGIKSIFDEQLFFILYGQKEVLFNYLTGKGRAAATALGTFTRGPNKFISFMRDKIKGYSGALSDDTRLAYLKMSTDPDNAARLTAAESLKIVREKSLYNPLGATDDKYISQLLVNNPQANESVISYIGMSMGSGGKFKDNGVIVLDDLTSQMRLEELGAKLGSKFTEDAGKLDLRQRGIVQWWQTISRFGYNSFKSGKNVEWIPANTFFKFNGLRTKDEVVGAFEEGMTKVGFKKNDMGAWVVADEKKVYDFLAPVADASKLRKQGMTDAEIASQRMQFILNDLRIQFSGGTEKAFNQKLFNLIKERTTPGGEKPPVGIVQAFRDLDFEDFLATSADNIMTGSFKTNIQFVGNDAVGAYTKFRDLMWEMMDRQVTSWHRVPAWMSTYLYKRNFYSKIEADFAANLKRTNPNLGDEAIQRLTERRFTEIAAKEATGELLRFVDNPGVRSQLAFAARNVGRFYRATEDFMRRIYRLRTVTPQVLYRLRLASIGLDGSGLVHQDSQGDRYVMMPMDDLIFQAVNPVMSVLAGGEAYKQPKFNEFSLKLSWANPSLQPDAGVPMLSGPIAGLSVWMTKAVAGKLPIPGGRGELFADRIDNWMLGDIGDNLTFRRAIVPVTWDRAWRILSSDEQDKYTVTTMHQAIAYMQANGMGLDPNATPEERYEYTKRLRIVAHNVNALKNIIGLTPMPFGITALETKDVPDYLKQVGISGIRQEFFDVYENLLARPNPRQDDLYEEALVAFIGSDPNRLIYTVSRAEKQRAIAFKRSDEVKDWYIRNKDVVNSYGDVAWLAAPNAGDFSLSSYAWFESAGLLKNRGFEDYLKEVQIAVDRQKYFDAQERAFDLMNQTIDPTQKALIKSGTQQYRQALRISNPLLDRALQSGDFGISKQEEMLRNLKEMLNDSNVIIPKVNRDRLQTAIEITNNAMYYFDSQTLEGRPGYVDNKKIYRDNALADLRKLAKGDPLMQQAIKAIFEPMLKFKSRDVL